LNRLFTVLNVLLVGFLLLFARQHSWAGLAATYMAFYCCYNPALVLLNPLSFYHINDPRTDFGSLRAWGSIGWMVPSAIIFALLAAKPDLDLTITVYVGAGTAALMFFASFLLPHTPIGITHTLETDDPRLSYGQAIRRLAGNPAYLILLVVYFLIASSFSIQAIYSPALLEEEGMLRKWIGPAQCVGVVLEIFLFYWQRSILHRLSYAHTILIGCLCMVARHFIFAGSNNLTLLVVSHLLTGLVIVFHHIGASLVVNAIAPKEVRSTAQTVLVLFGSGLGPMTANWCVSLIAKATDQNLRMVFLFAGLLAALGSAVIFLGARCVNRAAHAEDFPAQIPDSR
jgi:hypothetical protein